MWKWIIRLFFVAILVLGYCVYKGISNSLHAEHVLHAALITVEKLDEYVDTHEGTWPKSWQDLESTSPEEWAMFSWPQDSKEIQKYVEIDFNADLKRLIEQNPGEFDAVRPIGPYYPFQDHGRVEMLLETIRKHSLKKSGVSTP
jgi:L-rhamnose mutarotase